MDFFNKLRGEFIDIIEWTDDSRDTMVYRFERYNNEIKMGAKLIVRESQVAVFINKGKLADIFEPGDYTLATDNLPILSTLQGWKYGFNSPFKAEVYFVNTRRFTDLKWGTKNPITLRDPEFGPVRIRAFGTYAIRISNVANFIREIVGTDGHFTTDEITNQLRNLIVSRFTDLIGEAKIPVLDMAANYDELGEFITKKIHDDFVAYGIDITKMLVENISLPPAVEEILDKRTSMGIIGNLHQYTQFQTANAIEKAAETEGGLAGGGMGMGMGFAMANQMGQSMQQSQPPQNQQQQNSPNTSAPVPPPLPQEKPYYVAVNGQQQGPMPISQLQGLVNNGVMTRDSLVWCEGMSNWTKASEVGALSSLFAATPPPLPPQ
ncbi:SPFH domain-containing protein [Spartinivicinus poritis]|uniref:SPFH domain-containing protein n=1 Tax=Spartinivicinus poritis TaxID=2994640 RepID=A0ABT5UGR3_9GAMM|nr:SPFH domain-containing protein [Spartinivicinus sp. A2-2]MDE1465581.1 SPFH domain-containing protein [Spartinivicinus sp. A2-2]